MKIFEYQTYFIATDANHVTQHRRVVTPWFYVRLKSIRYIKAVCELGKFWFIDRNTQILSVADISGINYETLNKLEMVTMVFNKGDL